MRLKPRQDLSYTHLRQTYRQVKNCCVRLKQRQDLSYAFHCPRVQMVHVPLIECLHFEEHAHESGLSTDKELLSEAEVEGRSVKVRFVIFLSKSGSRDARNSSEPGGKVATRSSEFKSREARRSSKLGGKLEYARASRS